MAQEKQYTVHFSFAFFTLGSSVVSGGGNVVLHADSPESAAKEANEIMGWDDYDIEVEKIIESDTKNVYIPQVDEQSDIHYVLEV